MARIRYVAASVSVSVSVFLRNVCMYVGICVFVYLCICVFAISDSSAANEINIFHPHFFKRKKNY